MIVSNTQMVCKTESNAAKCRERPGLLRIDNYIVCAALQHHYPRKLSCILCEGQRSKRSQALSTREFTYTLMNINKIDCPLNAMIKFI